MFSRFQWIFNFNTCILNILYSRFFQVVRKISQPFDHRILRTSSGGNYLQSCRVNRTKHTFFYRLKMRVKFVTIKINGNVKFFWCNLTSYCSDVRSHTLYGTYQMNAIALYANKLLCSETTHHSVNRYSHLHTLSILLANTYMVSRTVNAHHCLWHWPCLYVVKTNMIVCK